MNRESTPVSNEGDHTPDDGCYECIKAEPTSSGVSKPDDPKSAAKPIQAGTDLPTRRRLQNNSRWSLASMLKMIVI